MTSFDTLDNEQKNAVTSDFKNTLVVAAPGAGKTTVIINRAAYLMKKKNVNAENMIIITFTRAAAENMKARFKSNFPNLDVPYFGTFHALFYKILSNKTKINIIDESTGFKIMKGALSAYTGTVKEEMVREVINAISVFKCSRESIEKFNCCVDKDILKHCLDLYESYKINNNLLDFEDLELKCIEFLSDERAFSYYNTLFRYILTDEFQDCDSLQLKFLKTFSKDNHIFAVGDEDQCIYTFRGSKPEYMVEFGENFADSNIISLNTNYRCPRNITCASQNLISMNFMRNKKAIRSYNTQNGDIKIVQCLDENDEAKKVTENILNLISDRKYKFSEVAILYRTNMESRIIIDRMISMDMPLKMLDGKYNFYNHFICKDIMSYMKLSLDEFDVESFINIINKPNRYISKLELEKLEKRKFKVDLWSYMLDGCTLGIHQKKSIMLMKIRIRRIKEMQPIKAVQYILKEMNYNRYLADFASKYSTDLKDLYAVAGQFETSVKQFKTIEELLIHIDKVSSDSFSAKDDNGVILSTIHGVKGMEFKNVFIINCCEGLIPITHDNSINIEEERRLFYVGITRAKENLYLFIPKRVENLERDISRFIGELSIKN